MVDDPVIEVFDVSRYAGMEYYAADSAGRLAPLYRRWAEASESERERQGCLRSAEVHETLAAKYRLADRIMREVEVALEQEEV